MCFRHDTSEFTRRSCFAEWLASHHTHEELASAVEGAFREKGPALPRQVRLDLRGFIEDRSTRALAECLAMNDDPSAHEGFAEWRRECAEESCDPYATFGVRRSDFCEGKGPGRE